ncbi:MAG: Fic family protein [Longimicrobiales bacterium]
MARLLQVEDWAKQRTPIAEDLIQRLHAIVERGPGRRPTPFRSTQNVVRDSASGGIEYMPPEPRDVPGLMADLVAYIHRAERSQEPAPIIAGVAHYQFETIHPFMDGNGRAGRLLPTLLLHRGGLGLRGFFSLEEYHAAICKPTTAGSRAGITTTTTSGARTPTSRRGWSTSCAAWPTSSRRPRRRRFADHGVPPEPEAVRKLDARARRVLALFGQHQAIAASDVARLFPIGDRMVRHLLSAWVKGGFLEVTNASRKSRRDGLTKVYREYIDALAAVPAVGAASQSAGKSATPSTVTRRGGRSRTRG